MRSEGGMMKGVEEGRKGVGGRATLALSAQLASVARATRHEEVVASSSRQSGLASGPGDAPGHRHSLQSRYDPRPAPAHHVPALPRPEPPVPHSAVVLLNVLRSSAAWFWHPRNTRGHAAPQRPRCGGVRGGRVMMWRIIDYHAIHSSSHSPVALTQKDRTLLPAAHPQGRDGGTALCWPPLKCPRVPRTGGGAPPFVLPGMEFRLRFTFCRKQSSRHSECLDARQVATQCPRHISCELLMRLATTRSDPSSPAFHCVSRNFHTPSQT